MTIPGGGPDVIAPVGSDEAAKRHSLDMLECTPGEEENVRDNLDEQAVWGCR